MSVNLRSVSFLYVIYGLLLRNWKVSDLFFWFWCEFLVSGLYVFVVTRFPCLPTLFKLRFQYLPTLRTDSLLADSSQFC